MTIAFYILATVAVLSALAAVRLRNLVHATLCLMGLFVALAGIYVLLMAEFIAAVQILVYVGAIGILILFAIMLTQHVTGEQKETIDSLGGLWGLAAATGVLLMLLLPGILLTSMPTQPTVAEVTPSVRDLGLSLMTPYTIALQAMGLLLTVALIGAVVIAIQPADKKK